MVKCVQKGEILQLRFSATRYLQPPALRLREYGITSLKWSDLYLGSPGVPSGGVRTHPRHTKLLCTPTELW